MRQCFHCGNDTLNERFCSTSCRNKVFTLKGYKQSAEHVSKRTKKGRETLLSRPDSIKRIADAKRGDKNPSKRFEVRMKISKANKGKAGWNKGRGKGWLIQKDYKMIKFPEHPRAWKSGYVYEHIIILEKKLGRPLDIREITHHIDGNKLNNDPKNLMAMSHSQHSSMHNPKGFRVGHFKGVSHISGQFPTTNV